MLLFSTLEIKIHSIQSTSKVIVEENVDMQPIFFHILFLKINFYSTFEQKSSFLPNECKHFANVAYVKIPIYKCESFIHCHT
jgi:hypothetical protein